MTEDRTAQLDHVVEPEQADQTLARRRLFRAGAMAAAATAGAVAVSAASAPSAHAANGDTLKVGSTSTGDAPTGLSISSSTSSPALRLTNPGGPSLQLVKTTKDLTADLAGGALAFTPSGLAVGLLDDDNAAYTTYVATEDELLEFALPEAISPARLLDTRYASGRTMIVGSSASALDSSYRLKSGAYLDIAVDAADDPDFSLQAAFVNVTATGALANGFLSLYPSGTTRTVSSTLNYVKGQTIANGAFVAVGVVGNSYAVRIYANSTTHGILDLTGATVTGLPGPKAPAQAARTAMSIKRTRARSSARFTRAMGSARRR